MSERPEGGITVTSKFLSTDGRKRWIEITDVESNISVQSGDEIKDDFILEEAKLLDLLREKIREHFEKLDRMGNICDDEIIQSNYEAFINLLDAGSMGWFNFPFSRKDYPEYLRAGWIPPFPNGLECIEYIFTENEDLICFPKFKDKEPHWRKYPKATYKEDVRKMFFEEIFKGEKTDE